jgi:hypothetical protein
VEAMKKSIMFILNIALISFISACEFGNIVLVPKSSRLNAELNPSFSLPGGFYDSAFELELDAKPETTIYYTLDGSIPTQEDLMWNGPLWIDEMWIDDNQAVQIIDDASDIPSAPISWIRSSYDKWTEPSGDIFAGTVIKAIAFDEDDNYSEVITNTYFVAPNMSSKYTFPIVSLSTDVMNLFGYDQGINVAGKMYDETIPLTTSNRTGNYFESGIEWERPITFEMFSTHGLTLINQEAGLRVHGGLSRKYPIKSYRLYARSEYDEASRFDYPFFENRDLARFKRLILRAGGQAYEYTFMGEAAAQKILEPLDLDIQYSAPVILFINGEYFGIRNIRDRFDTWYLENQYGVSRNQSTILTGHAFVDDGSQVGAANYLSMYRYITTKNMAVMKNYRHIEKQMDIDNFIDYYIAQLYFANKDWPQNNILYWKKNVMYQPNAPYGHDGRWRWMVYDVDAGFAASWGGNTPDINSYDVLTGETWKTGRLFKSLLNNPEFRSKYAYRLETLLDSVLSTESTLSVVNEMENLYAPEMQEHIDRWGYPTTYETWEFYVDRMKTFAEERPTYLHQFTQSFLNIDDQVSIRVKHNTDHGNVFVHDHLQSDGDLLLDAYMDLNLILEASSSEGYRFLGWYDETGELISKDHHIMIEPELGLELEARFEPGNELISLFISAQFIWIFQMVLGISLIIIFDQMRLSKLRNRI